MKKQSPKIDTVPRINSFLQYFPTYNNVTSHFGARVKEMKDSYLIQNSPTCESFSPAISFLSRSSNHRNQQTIVKLTENKSFSQSFHKRCTQLINISLYISKYEILWRVIQKNKKTNVGAARKSIQWHLYLGFFFWVYIQLHSGTHAAVGINVNDTAVLTLGNIKSKGKIDLVLSKQ